MEIDHFCLFQKQSMLFHGASKITTLPVLLRRQLMEDPNTHCIAPAAIAVQSKQGSAL